MLRPRSVLLPLLLVLVVGLGACSWLEGDSGSGSPRVPAAVEHEAVVNPDRDTDEVRSRIAALDPCALGTAAAPGARSASYSPSTCEVTLTAPYALVRVEIGTTLTQETRHRLDRRQLAGVVAYAADPTRSGCGWHLPVSQHQAITVTTRDEGCARTRLVAAGIARTLQEDPASALADPSPALVEPCEWARLGHGDLADDETLVPYLFDPVAGSGQCSVRAPQGGLSSALILGVSLDYAHRAHLLDPGPSARRIEVAGRVATADESQGDCSLMIAVAPVEGLRFDDVLRLQVVAPTCPEARQAAERMVTAVDALDLAAPDLTAGTPVLHPVEQTDAALLTEPVAGAEQSAVGGCVHVALAQERRCAPVVDVEVPHDPTDLVLAAQADAQVTCAAVEPLAREHLGKQIAAGAGVLGPDWALRDDSVVVPDEEPACFFGEPTHALHVTVRASWKALDDLDLRGGRQEEVAGHAAVVQEPGQLDGPARSWTVALGAPGDPGVLRFDLLVTVGRDRAADPHTTADESLLEPGAGFVEDTVRTLLDPSDG